MSDDSGKKVGAAAGAGGIGLMAILRVCSHEGHEVGVAARALQGVERGAIQEGAIVARGAGRAAEEGAVAARGGRALGAGEKAGLRGAGFLAAEGEGFGKRALELAPHLADLPLPAGDDDDTIGEKTPALPAARDLGSGALLERALHDGQPIKPALLAAGPLRATERW